MRKPDPIIIDASVLSAAAIREGLTMEVNGHTVISQTKIAKRLGVAQSTVSRILKGCPVSSALVDAVIRTFALSYDEAVRSKVAA